MSKYVWIILLALTLYILYTKDYQKTLGMKLHFFHDNILTTFFTIHKYISTTFTSSSSSLSNEDSVNDYSDNRNIKSGDTIFTANQLRKYSNVHDGLYLAILGQVYDVTKGEKHYGNQGSYHSFVGRDASLAFVTGDFTEEGLTDDVSSLTPLQIKSLNDWAMFYAKDYVYKGKLVGRYYDGDGNPTDEYKKIQDKLAAADKEKSDEEMRQRIFPPCNIEWKPEVGTRLWCTKRSGGIERDWIGVPRMLYEPGSEEHRCTCVNLKSKEYEIHQGNLREYEGCAKGSTSCVVKNS